MKTMLILAVLVGTSACGGTTEEVGTMHNVDDDRDLPALNPIGEDPGEREPEAVADIREPKPVDEEGVSVTDADEPEAPQLLDPIVVVPGSVTPMPVATQPADVGPEIIPVEPEAIVEPAPEPEEVPVEESGPTVEPEPEPVQEPDEGLRLTIEFEGPDAAEISPGTEDYAAFLFSLTVTEDMEIEGLPMQVECDGGLVYGSLGTPYLLNMRLMDMDTGATVAGPRELALPADGMFVESSWFVLDDRFPLARNTTRHFGIMLDVASFEDVPGEFFDNECTVTLGSLEGFVSVGSPAEILPGERINITDDIVGNPFVVSSAAWGEFSFCDRGGGFEGCCTTGGFARDYTEALSGMLVKSASDPAVYYVGSDARRYLFATRIEFFSWYGWDANDPTELPTFCANVRELPEDAIAGLLLEKQVPVRPGTYLLKISTDSYVHAVGRQGTLHKFWSWYPEGCGAVPLLGDPMCGAVGSGPSSGDEAHQLFPNAEARVRIISDERYLGYAINGAIGEPPVAVGSYDPLAEWDWGSPNMLEAELGLFVP
jgi:hypothetical protein